MPQGQTFGLLLGMANNHIACTTALQMELLSWKQRSYMLQKDY